MPAPHKPEGYTTVSPYLVVNGARSTIDFLVRVFDAVELRRFEDSSCKIMHAEVRVADSVVMLADGGPHWPPVPCYVHVYVPDVDATYRRALEAGAVSVQEPIKKSDADKRGGVKDPGGTTWWIATMLE
ncbi:MAG TPA: VOC family protein [Steroidobacteraceae bacterium]|nr:VOC family protein [Steroidobacteraceae bacterium]